MALHPLNPNRTGRSRGSSRPKDRRRPGPSFPTRSWSRPSRARKSSRRAAVEAGEGSRWGRGRPRSGCRCPRSRCRTSRDRRPPVRSRRLRTPILRGPRPPVTVPGRSARRRSPGPNARNRDRRRHPAPGASRQGAARVVASLGLAAVVVEAAGATALAATVIARLRAGSRGGGVSGPAADGARPGPLRRLRPPGSRRPRCGPRRHGLHSSLSARPVPTEPARHGGDDAHFEGGRRPPAPAGRHCRAAGARRGGAERWASAP